ncbi:hypothetical protein GXY_03423 [Novacetimonas hansenii ATCC 23769]|uniref:Uncharacterized protein n=1 Tax=Novacetimonas hansenii ATCC 23769 TaxID=714995 RepID=D5QC38_NOVHA|nr:hypothetical protein GXY_03423 [Novacetimonas hansenii ATCC 23769]
MTVMKKFFGDVFQKASKNAAFMKKDDTRKRLS